MTEEYLNHTFLTHVKDPRLAESQKVIQRTCIWHKRSSFLKMGQGCINTWCKIDSQWEAAVQHRDLRDLNLVLCDHLEGWDGGWTGREAQEGHIQLAHIVVWQKPAQYGKAVILQFSSVQFSGSVMSDFLRPYGLQHARPPCPSPAPGVYSSSCPLSR